MGGSCEHHRLASGLLCHAQMASEFCLRINSSVWTFVFSGLIALGIALLTISYQAIKAATANPADSLRYE